MHVASLWRDTARSAATGSPRLVGERTADVAIVGGGFTGLSAALHAAELGRSVVLVESADIAFGASGRNGGQVNPGLKLGEAELVARFGEAGRRFFRLGEESTDFLGALVERHAIACGWQRPGVLRLAHSDRALSVAKSAADALSARGIPARLLSRDAVVAMTGSTKYSGGLLDPRGGSVQPLDLARGLAGAAAAASVQLYENSPALAVDREGKRIRVRTPEGWVQAGQVIVATNGYSDRLIPGLAQTLLPVNSFQVATAPLPPESAARIMPGGHAAYDSRRLILYFRKTPDGRLMLGGRASFSSRRIDEGARMDYAVLEKVLYDLFPDARGTPVTHRWTGLVCITPDFLPHYHTPEPGVHVLVGYNGRGVALSIRAGAWLARHIAGVDDGTGIPATPIKPIPMHAFRAPVLDAAMRWNWLMDALGR